MSSNPIQRKTRNSALLGSAITLLITGAIIAFLLMQLMNMKKEQEELQASYVSVYTLNQDVKSGQIITEDMYTLGTALVDKVPNNATAMMETFINYSLMDNEGNEVFTDEAGIYLKKTSEYLELYKDENTNKYYTYSSDGKRTNIENVSTRDILKDSNGEYIARQTEGKTRLYKEATTEKYYILKLNYNSGSEQPIREKQYVDIIGAPLVAKINMNANTVITLDMLSRGNLLTDDIRKQEYNSIVLPMDLATGDYVDIRLQMPSGQDFIVLSKKMIEIPVVQGMDSVDTIWMSLSEEEILTMSCAIVEAYRINGSKLYATKYTDPGMQQAIIPTYPINAETIKLIEEDPNITDLAKKGLGDRYSVTLRNDYINEELRKPENTEANVTNKMNESITKTQEDRQKYLESLSGGY